MIRPRQWLPDVILVPGPARFDSPQLRAEVDALKAQAATKATTGDAEGAAFATAHPYAAGAILGGIAHRSEGGDRGA